VASPIVRASLLAAVTSLAYLPVLDNQFVFYDDDLYLLNNSAVRGGLTWNAVRWAFTTGHAANWHPLTWLSHLTDVQLFGLDPRGHHLTSLALHVANTVLLFLLLRRLTGDDGPSLIAAAVWGLHPAHVESVAWAAERKDVLSTLLGLATMAAYAGWSRRPSATRYLGVLVVFGLGLMAKPMLVTLPFVLLLLDQWPLGRFTRGGAEPSRSLRARVVEKLPLFALAAASSAVTFLVQQAGGAVKTFDAYPLGVRVANAVVAYAGYLRMLAWPTGLAVFYPHPEDSLSALRVAGCAALLAGVSVAAWRLRPRHPYLLVGWLWFVGTLVPVIGLVQVGWQAMADRYTYLPSIGLCVAAAWGVGAFLGRRAAPATWAVALAACFFLTRDQVGRWRDTETLMQHALRLTGENFLAHNNLGHFYNERGQPAAAVPQLEAAIRIRPKYAEARVNLGRSLVMLGQVDRAGVVLEEAIALRADDPVGLNNLAFVRMQQGRIPESVALYDRVLSLSPEWAEVQHRAGVLQLMAGDVRGGRARLAAAASLEAANAEYVLHARGIEDLASGRAEAPAARAFLAYLVTSHRQAAAVLAGRGQEREAQTHLRRASELSRERSP
jgi:tetratricopeptide (TPR) repeat protein